MISRIYPFMILTLPFISAYSAFANLVCSNMSEGGGYEVKFIYGDNNVILTAEVLQNIAGVKTETNLSCKAPSTNCDAGQVTTVYCSEDLNGTARPLDIQYEATLQRGGILRAPRVILQYGPAAKPRRAEVALMECREEMPK